MRWPLCCAILFVWGLLLSGSAAQSDPKSSPKFDTKTIFKHGDSNSDGKLSREEFQKLASQAPRLKDKPDVVKWLFDQLDANRDGLLSQEEYGKVFEVLKKAQAGKDDAAPKKETPIKETTATPTTEQIAFFEKKIRPVLLGKCLECHNAEKGKVRGGLALDTRAGLLKGGDSGPAIVVGHPEKSLLIKALHHSDDLRMPPKEKLSESVIADFERWVKTGAADPRDAKVTLPKVDTAAGRTFWAFQPVKKSPAPAVKDTAWPKDRIDRFLLSALETKGLTPVEDAARSTLLRRVYFDLTGLPPTIEQIRAFEKDTSEKAFANIVDALLASPQFGERWGRHWLDVARYAESSGKEVDFAYPQAWRYRDYVIAAFNADKPFDRFIHEQLAGDLLEARNPREQALLQIATGFLAMGPKSHIERNKLQFEMDVVDEQIDTTTQAFLGLTVSCARCHDHKFDPIPQTDYYALAGIFRSTQAYFGTIPVIQNANPGKLLTLPEGCDLSAGIPALSEAERTRLEKEIATLREKGNELRKGGKLVTQEGVQIRLRLTTLEGKLQNYLADGTPKMLAMGVREKSRAIDSPLYVRGEIEKPGQVVPRGFVQVVHQESAPKIRSGSGRLEMARWIASQENPLTARVFVNRVWLHLFGRGLVATPDNFGLSGSRPSHPELLDDLAATFVEQGWSVKKLIRRIVLSRAYQLSGTMNARNYEVDPDNALIWRMSPRRLDAEAIRDAMYSIAGKLELRPPVGSMVASQGEGYVAGLLLRGQTPPDQRSNHRSVYMPMMRGATLESLGLFDGVDGSAVMGQRAETTIPAQSMYLLNSPHVLRMAEAAASRLASESKSNREAIERAYLRWYAREAKSDEIDSALKYLESYIAQTRKSGKTQRQSQNAAWASLCQAMWASNEFLARK